MFKINNWFSMMIIVLPSFILFSLPTVGYADHGGNVFQCLENEIWDPNTEECVQTCPAGTAIGDGVGIPELIHCNLILFPVGGELIPLDTTMILVAGTHSVAAWMIPVIVSAIGFAIVISKKY